MSMTVDAEISIHAPLAGCDRGVRPDRLAGTHFNPRTPCGVRQCKRRGMREPDGFQSTHPLRGATAAIGHLVAMTTFQSTHPLRGATDVVKQASMNVLISIHAPLAGCDARLLRSRARGDVFQSTHPLRGATFFHAFYTCWSIFQSTHPLRGATKFLVLYGNIYEISIHAPLAGCDKDIYTTKAEYNEFQSTHPLRGATTHAAQGRGYFFISIHAPLAGCDGCSVTKNRRFSSFQSTHPLRGATGAVDLPSQVQPFQSTHPLRGATIAVCPRGIYGKISIHAPLAGCDLPNPAPAPQEADFNPRTPCGVRRVTLRPVFSTDTFQSTHPLRGATAPAPHGARGHAHFNPRTPCGVRRGTGGGIARIVPISIHAPLAGCDAAHQPRCKYSRDFNPRTPCGVRPATPGTNTRLCPFQSTHPLRGATLYLVPIRGSHRQQRADSLKNKYYQFKTNNYAF